MSQNEEYSSLTYPNEAIIYTGYEYQSITLLRLSLPSLSLSLPFCLHLSRPLFDPFNLSVYICIRICIHLTRQLVLQF